jgi:two-component system, OmpR family, sensor kinase
MRFPMLSRLNLRTRFGLWYSLLLIAAIAVVGALWLTTLQHAVYRRMDDALAQRAARLAGLVAQPDAAALDAQGIAALLQGAEVDGSLVAAGVYVEVRDRTGAVLGASANTPARQIAVSPGLLAEALAGRTAMADGRVGEERLRVLARPLAVGGRPAGVLLIGESLRELDATVRQAELLLGLVALAGVLLSALGSGWLTAHTLRPIIEVTRGAKRIAATGHVGERVTEPSTPAELHELAATLNEMLARLDQTVRRQRQFLADASHELRGPLMVIRGNLDLLQMDLPAEDRRASAAEATEEVERMAHLVGDLLFLAEQDAHERLESEPVALHEVVDEVWQRACNLDAGSHHLVLDCNEPTTVLGDRYRLSQMIWNLVDNALRYTNPGGRVSLCLRHEEGSAELAVADQGIGIPAEHVPLLFERFYRVDRARSRNESSTGLGLPIVKQVAEAHGGRVRVASELGVGTTFTVSLPLASKD